MPFSDILKEVVTGTDGALGAVIVGLDGIPVEGYAVSTELDFQTLAVEYSSLMKELEKRSSESSQTGCAREVSVITDKAGVILRRLNEEYFFILVINPEGNFGKGRFLLRLSVTKLLNEF